jgi:predicted ATP-grasp superfamily ATP-dependent carboligase
MSAPCRVLVTDPLQRAALSAVRALGRAGHHVVTCGESKGLAGVSRYAAEHVVISGQVALAADRFAESVAAVVKAKAIDVVLPVTDAASRMLLPRADMLACRVAGPSAAAYDRASNKELLMRLAPDCGLRVPLQRVMLRPGDPLPISDFGPASFVVKPARSVVEVNGTTIRVGVRYADSPAHLTDTVRQYPVEAFPLLIQERCAGEGIGVFLLRDRGRTLLAAGHRRLREKPPSGGVSTYREAVLVDPDLLVRCEALLDALEYSGPAMVEFKRDPDTGIASLMEINARLWGSVQLAVLAGVNFPLALVQWAMGESPVPAVLRPGVRCVWEWGELDHALSIWRRSRESLHLPPGTPVGARAALRALTDRRAADKCEVFEASDPMPMVAESWRWFATLVSGSA